MEGVIQRYLTQSTSKLTEVNLVDRMTVSDIKSGIRTTDGRIRVDSIHVAPLVPAHARDIDEYFCTHAYPCYVVCLVFSRHASRRLGRQNNGDFKPSRIQLCGKMKKIRTENIVMLLVWCLVTERNTRAVFCEPKHVPV